MKFEKVTTFALALSLGAFCIDFASPLRASAKCNRFDITCNPHIKPITKPLAESAWGTAGRAGYPAAAEAMKAKNAGRSAQGLSPLHKRLLKARYGNIVDNVRVIYNATMMEKWCGAGECVQIGGTESAAQTYGNNVYVVGPERPINLNQFLLLAHELKHVQQQKGRLDTFGYDYFKAYKQAGQNYENNRMEKEAEEEEVSWFAQRVICPSTGCQWK